MRFSVAQGLLLALAVIAHGAFLACFMMGVNAGILSCEVSCSVFFLLIVLLGVIQGEEQGIIIEEDSENNSSRVHVDQLIEQLADRREKLEVAEEKLEEAGSRMLSIEQENIYYKQKAESLSEELDTVKKSLEEARMEQTGVVEAKSEPVASLLPDEEHISSEVVDIVEEARACAFELKDETERAGIDVRIIDPGEPLLTSADPGLIRMLFRNVIDNSVKFMKRAGILQITLSDVEDDVFIVMKDNGEGVSSQETGHIFELNYQGENRNGGNGLGLAQVAAIVEHYGGRVYARSDSGMGFAVFVRIPKLSVEADHTLIAA